MEAKVANLEAHTKTLEAEIEALRANVTTLVHYSKGSSQDIEFRDSALQEVRASAHECIILLSFSRLLRIFCAAVSLTLYWTVFDFFSLTDSVVNRFPRESTSRK